MVVDRLTRRSSCLLRALIGDWGQAVGLFRAVSLQVVVLLVQLLENVGLLVKLQFGVPLGRSGYRVILVVSLGGMFRDTGLVQVSLALVEGNFTIIRRSLTGTLGLQLLEGSQAVE